MMCSLCDQFIWKEGGEVNARRVCKPCVEALASQAQITIVPDDKDRIFEDLYADIQDTVRAAVDDAVEETLSKLRRTKKPVKAA